MYCNDIIYIYIYIFQTLVCLIFYIEYTLKGMKTTQHLYDVVKRNENKRMPNQQNGKKCSFTGKNIETFTIDWRKFWPKPVLKVLSENMYTNNLKVKSLFFNKTQDFFQHTLLQFKNILTLVKNPYQYYNFNKIVLFDDF